jgi:hypothetical protein
LAWFQGCRRNIFYIKCNSIQAQSLAQHNFPYIWRKSLSMLIWLVTNCSNCVRSQGSPSRALCR